MATTAGPGFVYDKIARDYAKALRHQLDAKPFDRDLLGRFCAELPAGARVADLGCGPGHVTSYLASLGVDVTGLDISRGMVEEAGRRFPDVSFEVGDLMRLEHADDTWQAALAMFALIHVAPDDLGAAFDEMRRVLVPGGHLLIACHRGCGDLRAEHWLGQDVSLHCYLYEPAGLSEPLEAAGFAIREQHVRPPYPAEHPSDRVYVWAVAS
ncbi:MAG: class I SAM-dependent methyltransferase [Planctomycetota bacterium]|jgi:SAM-dependent methyltransferase